MTATITASLGDLDFDGTPDGDGISWCIEMIEGWHDGAPVAGSRLQAPYGETITAVHEQARPLVIRGTAYLTGGLIPLDALWFVAERTLKAATRLVYVPGLLTVTEPDLELQAYVRLVDGASPRSRRIGRLRALQFEVDLLAPDPRRYSSTLESDTSLTLVGAATTITDTITTLGDMPTHPTVTIDGPATNPRLEATTDDAKYLEYAGTLGPADSLVYDMAAGTATLNGTTNVLADLIAGSRFPMLLPGANSWTYSRDAGASDSLADVEYRDAYS